MSQGGTNDTLIIQIITVWWPHSFSRPRMGLWGGNYTLHQVLSVCVGDIFNKDQEGKKKKKVEFNHFTFNLNSFLF